VRSSSVGRSGDGTSLLGRSTELPPNPRTVVCGALPATDDGVASMDAPPAAVLAAIFALLVAVAAAAVELAEREGLRGVLATDTDADTEAEVEADSGPIAITPPTPMPVLCAPPPPPPLLALCAEDAGVGGRYTGWRRSAEPGRDGAALDTDVVAPRVLLCEGVVAAVVEPSAAKLPV